MKDKQSQEIQSSQIKIQEEEAAKLPPRPLWTYRGVSLNCFYVANENYYIAFDPREGIGLRLLSGRYASNHPSMSPLEAGTFQLLSQSQLWPKSEQLKLGELWLPPESFINKLPAMLLKGGTKADLDGIVKNKTKYQDILKTFGVEKYVFFSFDTEPDWKSKPTWNYVNPSREQTVADDDVIATTDSVK